MIKAIVFDFDNTLMDFMKMKQTAVDAAVDAMIDAGLKISKEQLKDEIYKIYWKEGIEDQQVFDKVIEKVLGKIDYKILANGIIGYRRAKEGMMCLYPHVHLTLITLVKMGLKMAIISDAPRLPVWMRIVSLGLTNYFDFVLTFDDTGEHKPSSKPFKKILELLTTLPEQTLMVGDWLERDILGAKNIGMKTVWAKYGNIFEKEQNNNININADYEISDIIELIDIIKKENYE